MKKIALLIVPLLFNPLNSQNIEIEYQNNYSNKTYDQATLQVTSYKAKFCLEEEPTKYHFESNNYYDLKKNKAYCVAAEAPKIGIDKKYLIERKQNKWIDTNEKTTILGYTCTKATGLFYEPLNGGLLETEIWYTKDIPYTIGPNGLMNTPGFVLKFKHKFICFTATKISTKKIEPIQIPNYPIVTREDINVMLEKKMGKFYNRNRKKRINK